MSGLHGIIIFVPILFLLILYLAWRLVKFVAGKAGKFEDDVKFLGGALILLVFVMGNQHTFFSASVDKRPGYLQLLDRKVDERIASQISDISRSADRLSSGEVNFNNIEEEISTLSIELHILEVLLEESGNKQESQLLILQNRAADLDEREEEIELLETLNERQMITLKRILFKETQSSGRISLFLGILISIPLFWISEAIRLRWLVPFWQRTFSKDNTTSFKGPSL